MKIPGRLHNMHRAIVAPRDSKSDVLALAAHLAARALGRTGVRHGAVIVFLPGMAEIRRVESLLRLSNRSIRISILHSDVIGTEEEEDVALGAERGSGHAILSSVVGARSVTFTDLQCAIIHPSMRAEVVGPSGLCQKTDQPVSDELQGNMAGRVARTHPGLVTYLYDFDDTETGLACLAANPQMAINASGDPMTIVIGSPSRLYLVLGTMQHLRRRDFPNVFWLRTPEMAELDARGVRPNGRVMACWAGVVLPILMRTMQTLPPKKFHIVEDTVLLCPGVKYADIVAATEFSEAGVWGYGKYSASTSGGSPGWHGTKGLSVSPSWVRAMTVVMENTRSAQLKHFDLWLKDRRRAGLQPSLDLLRPLAGYGHRQSSTCGSGAGFGGAWIPTSTDSVADCLRAQWP